MKTLEIKLTQHISLEHFEEIIVSAMEGGSNYWYTINNLEHLNFNLKCGNRTITEKIAYHLFHDRNFSVHVHNIENSKELLGIITQESLLKALEICQKEYPVSFYGLLEGQSDATDADIIFQYAVMGKIIFG